MNLDNAYLDKFVRATELAAYGASLYIGKNDKIAADKGAVDKMRDQLNKIDMDGTVVIGEGEMDEAPMLFIGEKVGTKIGQKIDIALDPLEGTNFVAKNLPNAFSVIAAANNNCLLNAPDTYMEKIVIGKNLPKNLLNLNNTVEKNINLLAEARNKKPNELSACVLKRDRHNKIVEKLSKMNVNINFITDGDISGALSVVGDKPLNDIYLGIGGAPEGVLTAAALSCLDGQMQARLVIREEEIDRAKKMGIKDHKKQYNIDELVKGDVIFCASGITDGDLVKGIKDQGDKFEVQTLALHKSGNINKKIVNKIIK
jgi:fructose-1,6-bisphosphatase II / sedoheptulose-1,7-bisphosphatase